MLCEIIAPGARFLPPSHGTAPDCGPRWAFERIFKCKVARSPWNLIAASLEQRVAATEKRRPWLFLIVFVVIVLIDCLPYLSP